MKLDKSFFLNDSVTQVAEDLIGMTLCTYFDKQFTCGIIVETEAYSYKEKACHAYNNRRTARTETLFAQPGTCYVYLCYGIHKLFNIVTNKEGIAEAVLIRAVEPVEGIDVMLHRRGFAEKNKQLTSGPGKLSQALGIGLNHDKLDLFGDVIWVEDRGKDLSGHQVEKSPRIGVAYAKDDALLPWRYSVRENIWVSKGNNTYSL